MSQPSQTQSTGLLRLQQLNALCNRFEAAWKSGARPVIEEHVADAPAHPSLLRHLVLLDIDYRKQAGESPTPEDYLGRFPTLERAWLMAALADELGEDASGGLLGTLVDGPPAPLAAEEFLDRLAARGLLAPDDHHAWRDRVRASPRTTVAAVVERLIAEGTIAEFQARALASPIPVPLVLGPYVLDGWIASGGMGNVFRATHRPMRRAVAVKVMHAGASKPEYRKRFQREVEVAARLRHPNVVTAFDAGEQDGITYLVTEWVDGEDLGRLVKRAGPLEPAVAIGHLVQAARGLGHAHSRGIIHRDVKPSNLIFGRDGVVRVLDVGLARPVAEANGGASSLMLDGMASTPDLTATGGLMGTVDYVSPEQADDPRQADERSDVYSLGCTLYYLLTGRPPYFGATIDACLQAHRRGPIPSVRGLRPEVPPALDEVVQRMLAREPARRPQNMSEVVTALEALAAPSRRITRRAAIVCGGLALLGGAAYLFGVRGRDRPRTPALARIPFDARAEQVRWARALGVPAEITNGVGMRFVLVPPGSFVMGTSAEAVRRLLGRAADPQQVRLLERERQHEVTIEEPFYLSATEVTVGQFRRFVDATRHQTLAEKAGTDEEGGWGWHPEEGWRRRKGWCWKDVDRLVLEADHPVPNLNWHDAAEFCRWLTDRTQEVCRLPTEAEWEFACRAGSAGAWSFGDEADPLPLHAWTKGNSDGIPHRVGRKQPNALGLYDVHGNLAEWCQAPEAVTRPPVEELGPDADRAQPVRGGNFLAEPERTRCGARHWEHPNSIGPGFRVVQVLRRAGVVGA